MTINSIRESRKTLNGPGQVPDNGGKGQAPPVHRAGPCASLQVHTVNDTDEVTRAGHKPFPLRPVVATLSAVNRRGVYRVEAEGIAAQSHSPERELARKLIATGYDPERPYHTIWAPDRPSMKWASLRVAASLSIGERAAGGIYHQPYRPSPFSAIASQTGESEPSDGG